MKKGLKLSVIALAIMSLKVRGEASIVAEISVGELVDKITILLIKKERISNPAKLKNIEKELQTLLETFSKLPSSSELTDLMLKLQVVNTKLWDIEDEIRFKELESKFDAEFISLARSVYITNDERCRIKRAINELLGSRLMEEKSYTEYVKTEMGT